MIYNDFEYNKKEFELMIMGNAPLTQLFASTMNRPSNVNMETGGV
jgi:hypothetical protein